MENNLAPLNIKSLLSEGKYNIPIYQRNYAWGEREITQLIQDIVDYSAKETKTNYYLGTLVVYERKTQTSLVYETIDGQQRLTTLSILLSVLKNEYSLQNSPANWFKLNLEFDSRINSTDTLHALFFDNKLDYKNYNPEINQAYIDIKKVLDRILKESKQTVDEFCEYLFEKVMILRVSVPEDTDLNHYFEIMNNRGEQLEKHEILKANCLDFLKDNETESYTFNLIWEACSNMEKYVQYGFSVEQRHHIFGKNDWNNLANSQFDELAEIIFTNKPKKDVDTTSFKLGSLLENNKAIKKDDGLQDDENPERFNSVINFSNFLLHVLRVQTKENIPLDDKQLLNIFEEYITNKDFVKTFALNLLKCKFLFDKYVIKREFSKGTDKWSLKRLKWNKDNKVSYVNSFSTTEEEETDYENKTALMLLAMFHVSTPTLVYKHWLNATLKYVFENQEINSNGFVQYLENLSKAYLLDRFLVINSKDYFEIIYINEGNPTNTVTDIDVSQLNNGTAVENFIFNYLDYLLWKSTTNFKNFEFTFRSSVEHYYPQNPMEGNKELEKEYLDNFGNLCLISSSKNSRLSNYMPQAKKDHYQNSTSIDSIKQRIMMSDPKWGKQEITNHNEQMKKILLNS